jgi:glyoxylase-like metal-dependent hydrolase (beta-lactamase superfamily II)
MRLHLDHIKNVGLFPDVDIIDGTHVHKGTLINPHQGRIPGTNITISHTPGHTGDHSSLLVETNEGTVMICGDLFWWEEGNEEKHDRASLLSLPDEFASDRSLLLRSRTAALRTGAALFIPGHGKPFRLESHDL